MNKNADWNKSFENHQILRRDKYSLHLRNTCDGNCWVTISMSDGGDLAVMGDVGPMVFAYTTGSLVRRISWMGQLEEVTGYVCEKARIGMGRDLAEYDSDEWKTDVISLFGDYIEAAEEAEDPGLEKLKEQLTWEAYESEVDMETAGSVENGGQAYAVRELIEFLESAGCEDAWEGIESIGAVVGQDLGACHAALRRAYLLLEAEGVYEKQRHPHGAESCGMSFCSGEGLRSQPDGCTF
jgi:hypothetical protein